MLDEDKLDDLLVKWGEARDEGQDLSAHELCAGSPDMALELSRRIGNVMAIQHFIDARDDREASAPSMTQDSATSLPESSLSAEDFAAAITDSGLMTANELSGFRQAHPSPDSRTLASQLVEHEKLTAYQASVLLQQRNSPLLLDKYVILDTIDAGGMGLVFKALHRPMERIVALKTLPPAAVNSADKVRRFQREVKAAAKLTHPNIVHAYDADQANGTHFLVMEYVHGQDLAKLVKRRGPLSVGQAVHCTLQAARGLEHAHGENVVHRDIKPGNLLASRKGAVKVLDMGLARIDQTEDETPVSMELTQAGSVMGTAGFMAPEQGLDTKDADARSDIYSLGCTLFFLLTGKPPYVEESLMKTIMAHNQRPIPSLTKERSDVPESLDKLFQRMLAKQPADRYQTVTELIEGLEACGISTEPPVVSGGQDITTTEPLAETYEYMPQRHEDVAGGPTTRPSSRRLVIGGALVIVAMATLFILWAAGAFTTGSDPDSVSSQAKSGSAIGESVDDEFERGRHFALSFDGNDDYVEIPKLVTNPSEAFTLEAWLTPTRLKNGTVIYQSTGGKLVLSEVDPWKWRFHIQDKGLRGAIVCDEQANVGESAHIAVTGDGKQLRLFVNGQPCCDAKGTFIKDREDSKVDPVTRIGMGEASSFFKGRMSEVRFSNSVRYTEGFTPQKRFEPDAPTLALYHFDEGQGDVLKDSSGNGHHGKIHGATWVKADGSPLQGRNEWPADAPPPAIAPFKADQAKKHQEAWAKYLSVPVEYTNPMGMKFRLIPPGEFKMGSTEEQIQRVMDYDDVADGKFAEHTLSILRSEMPLHRVVVTKPFYLGVTPVTVEQFRRFADASGHKTTAEKLPRGGYRWMGDPLHQFVQRPEHAWSFPEFYDGKDSAVVMLSFSDCESFSRWLSKDAKMNYGIPTEAEWEYACRAGTTTHYCFGDDPQLVDAYGSTSNEYKSGQVGQKQANSWGLHGMHGMPAEYCSDFFHHEFYGSSPLYDPQAKVALGGRRRVVRSGRNSNPGGDPRMSSRSASRHISPAEDAPPTNFLGFRVAIALEVALEGAQSTKFQADAVTD